MRGSRAAVCIAGAGAARQGVAACGSASGAQPAPCCRAAPGTAAEPPPAVPRHRAVVFRVNPQYSTRLCTMSSSQLRHRSSASTCNSRPERLGAEDSVSISIPGFMRKPNGNTLDRFDDQRGAQTKCLLRTLPGASMRRHLHSHRPTAGVRTQQKERLFSRQSYPLHTF